MFWVSKAFCLPYRFHMGQNRGSILEVNMSTKKDFEIVPHTADLKLRVYGTSKEELFKNALVGMFQSLKPIAPNCVYEHDRLICKNLPISREIGTDSPDEEALLVDFLSSALYFSDVHNEVYLDVEFTIFESTKLAGMLKGVPITGLQESEIKAVTYHDLKLHLENGIWQTDIVFDI